MTIKKPIPITFNLDSHNSVQSVCAVIHIDDKNTETLDLSLMQGGEHIAVSPNSTVTARFVRVKNNTLISDDVACTVQENGNIHIPIDNAAAHMLVGEIKIEVNIVDENDILTMQFPLVIRVNNTILADAGICPISKGTIPELIEEAREAAESATQAAEAATEALNHKLSSAAGAVKTANIDTGAVTEAKLATDSVATAKIKDSNVTEAKLAANSVTTAKIKDGNVTEAKLAAAVSEKISTKENASNKVTSLSSSSTDTEYPSAKCVYDMIGNIEALLSQV